MWSTATTTTTHVRALSIDKMAVLDADGVTVEEGDRLCLHTGFAQLLLDAGDEPDARGLMMSTPALDGRDPLLQAWITDSGVATISADKIAVEARPATPATTPCAALPPLRVPGAVGSPANGVATV
jgi:hypothetical protein